MRTFFLACLFCLLTGAAFAETISAADKAAFQNIIGAQISAFKSDDAAGAFGFASPDLQEKFGSPGAFLNIVKSGYAPVYRPRSVEFREVIEHVGQPEQLVFVIGPDGRGYLAHYMMERQPDGSWRISGCYLERARDESV